MYSSHSPALSSIDQQFVGLGSSTNGTCLKFKYFITFIISTVCLALLSGSLATHKWLTSKPIRILKLNGGQTNFSTLMLNAQESDTHPTRSLSSPLIHQQANNHNNQFNQHVAQHQQQNQFPFLPPNQESSQVISNHNNKFQGEIYFGLFRGVKVLNYGFGDRLSQILVCQTYFSRDNYQGNQQHYELVDFKFWLVTVSCVAIAIIFALVGTIFAIINFVMTPRGTLRGPVGLVAWNAIACFACLLAALSWLIEFFVRLQANILSPEEIQNGWTSENRSQFGYSYYFVVLALVLHLVNIFLVSIVQFETWNGSKASKRQTRAACEGVIMLY